MAALIRKKSATGNDRDEIPPGTLYLLILKTLAVRGRLHGYEIAESIQSCSDDVLQIEEGSLYPALQRMLIKGWVTPEWGITAAIAGLAITHSHAMVKSSSALRYCSSSMLWALFPESSRWLKEMYGPRRRIETTALYAAPSRPVPTRKLLQRPSLDRRIRGTDPPSPSPTTPGNPGTLKADCIVSV